MASSYSQYKIELQATGENSGTWGTITNANFGSASPGVYQGFEQAIGGRADITMSSTTVTLTLTDTNAAQNARALYLNLSGTPGGAADLVVPALQKAYLVKNGTNAVVTIKVTGQTGVPVPVGRTVWVYNNGTDVVTAVDHIPALTLGAALPVASGGSGATTLTGVLKGNGTSAFTAGQVNLTTEVTGTLPVANGGTGITAFGTGVATALGVNVGTAGAVVVNGGALGTPASGTLTNATGLPLTTGVTGVLPAANGGTGVNNSTRTLTVNSNSGTLNFTAASKTLGISNSLTLAGTDATTMTFPSTSATIARTDAGQTFTGTQVMTSPRIVTSINDTNGNEVFGITATGSAVNELTIANAATGNNPVISATGGDTNIGITLTPKGTGGVVMNSTATATKLIPTGNVTAGNGMYLPAANTVAIGTNGSAAITVDSSQNVGIGKTPTNKKLEIYGDTDPAIRIQNSTTGITATDGLLIEQGGSDSYFVNYESGNMLFYTANIERARITSGGYFKASNTGSYINSTAVFHEFVNSANDRAMFIRTSDASFTTLVLQVDATRSANSAYSLAEFTSGENVDTEFKFRGDGNAYADGTWNNNGADYAEFFESANGEALTLGATVVLDGNKVREATDQDPATSIVGVVRPKEPSKASMMIGNTAWNKWTNKYLTDDFDRYIMEDHDVVEWEETITDEEGKTSTKQHSYESQNIPAGITVPADATIKTHDDKGNKFQHYKLNPAWNPDSEYVNRENRPEWNIIGLLGQVKILKGQPVGDRWIKMRDVSATVEEWMIR